jgi:hypothetical protein
MSITAVASRNLMAVRPYRTPRLPELVSQEVAAQILGVHKQTLHRWRQPGSGTPESSFPPENTYFIPPAYVEGISQPTPCWVKADVVRFGRERGRQRQPAQQHNTSP